MRKTKVYSAFLRPVYDANFHYSDEQERSFLIDEALEFRIGRFEGQPTFQWRDLDDDEDDLYEFVASGVNAPTVTTFELATYRAMYERKYGKGSDDVPEHELRQFVYRYVNSNETWFYSISVSASDPGLKRLMY